MKTAHLNFMLAVIGLAVLSGCASVPMTSAALDAEGKKFVPESGKASIYVNRAGGMGTAVTVQTVLDGRIVGALAPNTYQLLSVTAGQHILSTSGLENVEQVKIDAEAGNNYFYRLSLGMGWMTPRAHIKSVDEEEGRRDVLKSKRAEAASYSELR